MMRSIFLVGLLFISMTIGCQNISFRQKLRNDYKTRLSSFKSILVSHFPKELPDSTKHLHSIHLEESNLLSYCFGVGGLYLNVKYSNIEYYNEKYQLINFAKGIYKPSDTNLLLVFSYCDVLDIDGNIYKNQETTERKKLAKRNITTSNTLPVPVFEIDAYHNDKNPCGLSDDFKILVLEAKTGKFLEEKYLQDCECMPEKWKHGFSRGIAANDKEHIIIYWLAVW